LKGFISSEHNALLIKGSHKKTGDLVLPVELVPQTAVYVSLTGENLFIVSLTLLIFVAVCAKELLKVLLL